MSKLNTTSELELVMDAVFRSIALQELDLPDEFFPAHLSVALIDAIFGSQYRSRELSMPAATRYCRYFGIARSRDNRWKSPPANEQETLGDLIRHYDELGLDTMTIEVFGIQCDFPEQKVTRATTLLDAAKLLRSAGIDVIQDLSARRPDELGEALQAVPGIGEQTVRRLLMYTGCDDFVCADVHVRRFVASAISRRSVSPERATALVRGAAYELIVSPKFLDYRIWQLGLSRSRSDRRRAPLPR